MPAGLVDFWRRCTLDAPPYAHPDDMPALQADGGKHVDAEHRDFDAYVNGPRFGDFDDHRLHLALLPTPYGGDLAHADIVVLLLNPGLSHSDYFAETRMPAFRRRLELNLRQSFEATDFPFFWLDPEFCWHAGFGGWERKLRDVATVIARERFGGRYLDALRSFAGRMAHLDLVPYHSPSFRAHSLVERLPSVEAARGFVYRSLLPAARRGEKTIIVTRQAARWRLPTKGRGLVVYSGGQTRGASLGPSTSGGRAILRRYGLQRRLGTRASASAAVS
jgi:hypothetical protein